MILHITDLKSHQYAVKPEGREQTENNEILSPNITGKLRIYRMYK